MKIDGRIKSFTLIEFLVVILIISIMAGGVVVMMSNFSHRQTLDISADALAGDLRQAQQFARAQRDGYKYYGLRFYNNLGAENDRQGWKILCYCQVTNGACAGEVTPPISDATTFRVIKSSVISDNDGKGPEILDNTFFAQRVIIDASSEFQISPTPPKLHSIVFIPEGAATKDGTNFLDDNTDEIKLSRDGNTRTIRITPLTGHVKIE